MRYCRRGVEGRCIKCLLSDFARSLTACRQPIHAVSASSGLGGTHPEQFSEGGMGTLQKEKVQCTINK